MWIYDTVMTSKSNIPVRAGSVSQKSSFQRKLCPNLPCSADLRPSANLFPHGRSTTKTNAELSTKFWKVASGGGLKEQRRWSSSRHLLAITERSMGSQ